MLKPISGQYTICHLLLDIFYPPRNQQLLPELQVDFKRLIINFGLPIYRNNLSDLTAFIQQSSNEHVILVLNSLDYKQTKLF